MSYPPPAAQQPGPPYPPQQPPGRPPRSWYKKKRFFIPLGLLAFFIVVGSIGGANTDSTVTAEPESSQTTEPATSPSAAQSQAPTKAPAAATKVPAAPKKQPASAPGVGDKVRDGKFEFVVKDMSTKSSVGNEYLNKDAQGKFLLINVQVTNIGDKAQTLFGDNQKLMDAKGREFSADTEAAIYMGDSKSFIEEINPGNALNGVIVFDIPKDAKPASIQLHDSAFSGGVKVDLK